MSFRQLLPEAGTVEIDELLESLGGLSARAAADRPYTVVNFVTSADGRATLGGRSGGLGDDGDRAMFHGLRERFDAVMAGTTTLKLERYGRILGRPERRERRRRRGMSPEPLACIFSRSGQIPTEIPLFAEPEARIVVFSPRELDPAGFAAEVNVVVLDRSELTLHTAMRRLRHDFRVGSLLCEGGPTMFGALLGEDLADELFLTVAPKLAGGDRGPTITSGPELSEPRALALRWLLERDGSLYHRYAIGHAAEV